MDDIVKEAREFFEYADERESENRRRARADIRFSAGEQWDERVRNQRELDGRPCLTMDKMGQYLRQVENDARQNKPAIKVRPVDSNADVKTAEMLDGLIRNIEDQSRADIAYITALGYAIRGGVGYFRIATDYMDDEGFDQDIFIRRVRDPLSVWFDPDAEEPEGSDAERCLISELMPIRTFERLYPDASKLDFESMGASWATKEHVRVAEYYYRTYSKKTLARIDGVVQEIKSTEGVDRSLIRIVKVPEVKWCKVNGQEELESTVFPSRYIPILRVLGNEIMIDDKPRYSGMIDSAADAMRMYNYMASAFVERVALAPLAPWIAEADQVAPFEAEWRDANKRNVSVLRYKATTVNGNLIGAPQRNPQADIPAAFVTGLQLTEHDIQGALGMYNASLGEQSNEKSGKAILARQKESDTATYHYIDNLSRAIRHAGRIIVDLIPKIYDQQRIVRVLGEDGTANSAMIDPNAPQSYMEMQGFNGDIARIYNPKLGKYDVSVSVGPSYNTKRVEAAEMMTAIVSAAPDLLKLGGDIMVRNMDWPGADELAKRLKKTLPPELQEDDDSGNPEMQLMQQQYEQVIQQMQQQMQAAMQELQKIQGSTEAVKLDAKEREIELTAEIERLKIELERVQAQAALREEAQRNMWDLHRAEMRNTDDNTAF
ncbi:portal protein [Methylocaldum gracile]|jgi:hypothetical protein|uniref:portal protein n=1 Tax=Methylocaldum sp. 0917 TaxID=2485163 RepID=UPI00105DDF99